MTKKVVSNVLNLEKFGIKIVRKTGYLLKRNCVINRSELKDQNRQNLKKKKLNSK